MSLASGELLAIRGASGSGKTTLLHVLAGLLPPSSGQVLFRGKRIDNLSKNKLSDLRLTSFGFVFQSGDLLPELTVAENIGLPLRFAGVSTKDRELRVHELLEELGISGLGGRNLSQISGGQLQRAAIARALVHRPAVIFADEPTGALDDTSAQGVLAALLGAARAQQTGVVLVTHSNALGQECDRELTLSAGRVVTEQQHRVGQAS